MTQPTTAKGTKLLILLGDGATPEVFTKFCGLTAKGINFQTNTNEFFIPDCDNPDDPAWRELTKAGRFAEISGSGILDTQGALSRMQAAYDDENAVNMRVMIDIANALGGGYWRGPFMLTGLNITGNDGELINAEITLGSSGPVVWVPA